MSKLIVMEGTWGVYGSGSLFGGDVDGDDNSGVRPVVTIQKSVLN